MATASEWWLLIGLGNPGRQYEGTRHNVGFEVIDALAHRWGVSLKSESRIKADVGTGTARLLNEKANIGHKVILAKPTTYMNLSGEAVQALMSFYKVPLNQVLVMSDDIALPVGRLRLRPNGSDGGHNGLKSIIQHGGGIGFPRLRVGVGQPPAGGASQVAHVLGGFTADEIKLLEPTLATCLLVVESFLANGVEPTMTRFNGWGEVPKTPKIKPVTLQTPPAIESAPGVSLSPDDV
ncbi:MAG: aminoacyl-tRNA hydrolase [Vampirovibrionales bacterium]|nr:aminoacyl-tRNA hydrolase [Vampirovibrionales bacterium]